MERPPDEVAGAGVQREGRPGAALDAPQVPLREAAERREVDEAVENRRRAHDPAGRVEAPAEVPCARVDRGEPAVPRSDEHHVPPHRGGRVHIRPRLARPEQMAGGRSVRVDGPIRVAEVHAPVCNCRSGVEVLPPAEARERLRAPSLLARPRIEGVHAAAVRAHVDGSVGVRRRSHDLVVGLVAPDQAVPLPAHVERVDPVVPRPEVEDAAHQQRRRLDRARPEPPFGAARLGVERDHHPGARTVLLTRPAVHQRDVERPARDRRRAGNAIRKGALPADLPHPRVDGVQHAAPVRDEDAPIRDYSGRLERPFCLERP